VGRTGPPTAGRRRREPRGPQLLSGRSCYSPRSARVRTPGSGDPPGRALAPWTSRCPLGAPTREPRVDDRPSQQRSGRLTTPWRFRSGGRGGAIGPAKPIVGRCASGADPARQAGSLRPAACRRRGQARAGLVCAADSGLAVGGVPRRHGVPRVCGVGFLDSGIVVPLENDMGRRVVRPDFAIACWNWSPPAPRLRRCDQDETTTSRRRLGRGGLAAGLARWRGVRRLLCRG
jgi:hypothetical protein